mgnify:CR=1 FL=1
MADLTTTVTESVVLNGALRGNTNSVTTTGINNVFGTLQDIASLQVRPVGAVYSPQVAVFVGAI